MGSRGGWGLGSVGKGWWGPECGGGLGGGWIGLVGSRGG